MNDGAINGTLLVEVRRSSGWMESTEHGRMMQNSNCSPLSPSWWVCNKIHHKRWTDRGVDGEEKLLVLTYKGRPPTITGCRFHFGTLTEAAAAAVVGCLNNRA